MQSCAGMHIAARTRSTAGAGAQHRHRTAPPPWSGQRVLREEAGRALRWDCCLEDCSCCMGGSAHLHAPAHQLCCAMSDLRIAMALPPKCNGFSATGLHCEVA